ncbi:hypothetical protein [Solidesulfovibrio sp.]
MLSLSYAITIFVLYFLAMAAYYRLYFSKRIYLLLLTEQSYMDHYIDKLPHIRDRPDERIGMIEFMLTRRRGFVRRVRQFVSAATAVYLMALAVGTAL